MSSHSLFEIFVSLHIMGGSVGLLTFWIPVLGRKGTRTHVQFGKVFGYTMLITGVAAVATSFTTLYDPVGTHPDVLKWGDLRFADPAMVSGVFGWMMLCLAVLTVNLAWHGLLCISNRKNHFANRAWHNLLLQGALLATSLVCIWLSIELDYLMMTCVGILGVVTVATNLWFLYKPNLRPEDRLKEHVKSLVGAGISVYTAFLAFGALRILPKAALSLQLWAFPLIFGILAIIYFRYVISRRFARVTTRPREGQSASNKYESKSVVS